MNYKVKYYGHSAYSVETSNHFLLFDYVGKLNYNYNNDNVYIDESDINFETINKPITMFHSHTHFDHYNKQMHIKLSHNDNIFTIIGGEISKIKNTTYLFGGDSININNIQIFAGNSTDIGVCFLINVDGIQIYYAGDNIDWGDSNKTSFSYINYIDNLSHNINLPVDIAFVPVCNFSGQMYPSLTESAIYACKKLNAKEVYCIHSLHGNKPYVFFKQYCEMMNTGLNIRIIEKEK